ncbi:MAG: acyl-CoA dehydratase activase [Chloroflexota bacterium]
MEVYLGIDSGSVSTKLAAINNKGDLICHVYLLTKGKPIEAMQEGLRQIKDRLPHGAEISGVAATGSARYLIGVVTGADMTKNEITCQALATLGQMPDVRTIIEIGGQDSKIILIRDGLVSDFGMNTVCAAGTGSFLDHQAARLNMSIEEFSRRALESTAPVRIAGRCTVFAESDMIHKQQMGHPVQDIVYGLCQALVRNYLTSVAPGKEIKPPVVFQGGVSLNQGILKAFREELGIEIIVPPNTAILGAIGAARLVREKMNGNKSLSRFKGMNITGENYQASSFACRDCPNACEIAGLSLNNKMLARWGGRCNRWG